MADPDPPIPPCPPSQSSPPPSPTTQRLLFENHLRAQNQHPEQILLAEPTPTMKFLLQRNAIYERFRKEQEAIQAAIQPHLPTVQQRASVIQQIAAFQQVPAPTVQQTPAVHQPNVRYEQYLRGQRLAVQQVALNDFIAMGSVPPWDTFDWDAIMAANPKSTRERSVKLWEGMVKDFVGGGGVIAGRAKSRGEGKKKGKGGVDGSVERKKKNGKKSVLSNGVSTKAGADKENETLTPRKQITNVMNVEARISLQSTPEEVKQARKYLESKKTPGEAAAAEGMEAYAQYLAGTGRNVGKDMEAMGACTAEEVEDVNKFLKTGKIPQKGFGSAEAVTKGMEKYKRAMKEVGRDPVEELEGLMPEGYTKEEVGMMKKFLRDGMVDVGPVGGVKVGKLVSDCLPKGEVEMIQAYLRSGQAVVDGVRKGSGTSVRDRHRNEDHGGPLPLASRYVPPTCEDGKESTEGEQNDDGAVGKLGGPVTIPDPSNGEIKKKKKKKKKKNKKKKPNPIPPPSCTSSDDMNASVGTSAFMLSDDELDAYEFSPELYNKPEEDPHEETEEYESEYEPEEIQQSIPEAEYHQEYEEHDGPSKKYTKRKKTKKQEMFCGPWPSGKVEDTYLTEGLRLLEMVWHLEDHPALRKKYGV